MPHEGLGQTAGARDDAEGEIAVPVAEDVVRRPVAVGEDQRDLGAEGDLAGELQRGEVGALHLLDLAGHVGLLLEEHALQVLRGLVLEVLAQIAVAAGGFDILHVLGNGLLDQDAVALLAFVEAAEGGDREQKRGFGRGRERDGRGDDVREVLEDRLFDRALLQGLPGALHGVDALVEGRSLDLGHALHLALDPFLVAEDLGDLVLQSQRLAHDLGLEAEQRLGGERGARHERRDVRVLLVAADPEDDRVGGRDVLDERGHLRDERRLRNRVGGERLGQQAVEQAVGHLVEHARQAGADGRVAIDGERRDEILDDGGRELGGGVEDDGGLAEGAEQVHLAVVRHGELLLVAAAHRDGKLGEAEGERQHQRAHLVVVAVRRGRGLEHEAEAVGQDGALLVGEADGARRAGELAHRGHEARHVVERGDLLDEVDGAADHGAFAQLDKLGLLGSGGDADAGVTLELATRA